MIMFGLFTRIVYTIFSSRATGIFVIAKDFRFQLRHQAIIFHAGTIIGIDFLLVAILNHNFATPRNTPRITKALYPTKPLGQL